MATSNLQQCPICKDELLKGPTPSEKNLYDFYECRRCVRFLASNYVFGTPEFDKVRHLVSAWIRRENDNGQWHPIVGGEFIKETSIGLTRLPI